MIYHSLSPSPYCLPQANKLTILSVTDSMVVYKRQYISGKDGTISKGIIGEISRNKYRSAHRIAEVIHWGCSGTATLNPLQSLIDWVDSHLTNGSDLNTNVR